MQRSTLSNEADPCLIVRAQRETWHFYHESNREYQYIRRGDVTFVWQCVAKIYPPPAPAPTAPLPPGPADVIEDRRSATAQEDTEEDVTVGTAKERKKKKRESDAYEQHEGEKRRKKDKA